MAGYVFVSYSSKDHDVAYQLCGELEGRGLVCWVAPRDIKPGANWGGSIARAIDECAAMVLVYSPHADTSEQIKKELTLAGSANKVVVPARLADIVPRDPAFRYELASRQWIDLFDNWEAGVDRLVDSLGQIDAVDHAPVSSRTSPAPVPPLLPVRRRASVAMWAAASAAVVLATVVLYLVLRPSDGVGVLQTMTADQLEAALAERRKADKEAAARQQAEEEARRQAELQAAAKRQADQELEKARADRQKAEEELARLKAETEARLKAQADERDRALAAARAEAEEEARKKAEAEFAALQRAEQEARAKAQAETDAKQKADAELAKALADRQRAEQQAADKRAAEEDAKRKADSDALKAAMKRQAEEDAKAKAQAQAEADARKAAEAAEAALRLSQIDRQRLQIALTAQGFDTRGSDGAFGPRTREMVAAWQKARNQPATGFVTAAQQQQLLREAAAALQKYDDDQKKAEEERKKAQEEVKKKAEEEARAKAAAAAPPIAATPPSAPTGFDGSYGGGLTLSRQGVWPMPGSLNVTVAGSSLRGQLQSRCGSYPVSLSVSASGEISGSVTMADGSPTCSTLTYSATGRINADTIDFVLSGIGANVRGQLKKGAGSAAPSGVPQQAAAPSPTPGGSFDGSYEGQMVGTVSAGAMSGQTFYTARLAVAGGRLSGTAVERKCGTYKVEAGVSPSGDISGQVTFPDDAFCVPTIANISGHLSGNALTIELRTPRGSVKGALNRTGG